MAQAGFLDIKIYHYMESTLEWHHTSYAREDPLDKGRPLVPAWSTTLEPPTLKDNEAAIFNRASETWSVVVDYRKFKLWSKDTAQPVTAQLGDTPASLNATELDPAGIDYPLWDGAKWVNDEGKANAQIESANKELLKRKISKAKNVISAVEHLFVAGILDEEETKSYTEWLTYSLQLARVHKQPGYALTVNWPIEPVNGLGDLYS